MDINRRSLLSMFFAAPLAASIQTAELEMVESGPVGLWLHFEEGPASIKLYDYFQDLAAFVKKRSGRNWLVHYSRQTANANMETEYMREFREQAIKGETIATMIFQLPERSNYRTSVGLPTAAYYMADVITYKPLDGPVKFIKCRWNDSVKETEIFEATMRASQDIPATYWGIA
jgi:hypothetical protein